MADTDYETETTMNTDINSKIEKTDIKEITQDAVWQRMPMRIQDSHKGTYGKLLCVAGSSRYRGAAALTAEGALRGGCGIVTLASVEPVFASIQPRLPECILLSCLPDEKGGISEANAESLKAELSNDYAALLMGPGMGNTPDTGSLVRMLTQNAECTVILDADALNALTLPVAEMSASNDMKKSQISSALKQQILSDSQKQRSSDSEKQCPSDPEKQRLEKQSFFNSEKQRRPSCSLPSPLSGHQLIITPHPGEMARLCGCSIADIKANREEIALSFAEENNCIVVLKEHRTLIASPNGQLWRNTSGNSGLARGGSGDILAGMMASFAAQGMKPVDAAICAVWLHGAAAERCSRRKSETIMLPHDIFEDLGQMFLENDR